MQRFLQGFALFALVVVALLITGVLDERYILAFFALLGTPAEGASDVAQRVFEALFKGDWKSLGAISGPLLKTALLVYFIRSFLFVLAIIVLVLWAVPYLKRAYASLRSLTPEVDDEVLSATDADVRRGIVSILRGRAARKRAESYAFLVTGLICLVLAVGFVTRDHYQEPVQSLEYGVLSPTDALMKSEAVLRDGRFEDESRRQEALQYERDVFDLVSRQVESPIEGSRIELAKSSHGLLTSLVNRGATKGMTDQSNEASVAREYIAFARSQLEVAGRQAKLELIQQTAIAVTIKVAALVLVLALARALIRLYDRGLRLSIQYEGIADSLLLAPRDLHVDFERLRRELTPIDSRESEARLPRSVLHAVNELLADAKVSLLKKDPKPGA